MDHGKIATIYFPPGKHSGSSYALGGGLDAPFFRGFNVRVTADFLGGSMYLKNLSSGSNSHYRFGAGLAYHF